MWSGEHGCKDTLNNITKLGYKECLLGYNKKLIPTFKNAQNKKIIHQMDHLFASNSLYEKLISCKVLDDLNIFEDSISDHLPILAEFKL